MIKQEPVICRTKWRNKIGGGATILVGHASNRIVVKTWLPAGMNWDKDAPEWIDWCDSLEQARTAYKQRAANLGRLGFSRIA